MIYYLYNDNIYQKQQKAVYNANNQLLIKKIREVYDDKVETDRTNRELREAIARDKASGFDWSQNIGNTAPVVALKRLHKNRNKIR